MQQQSQRVLGIFSLVMITVGSVDSIRNLPTTSIFGAALIFFFIVAALLFLLPAALVAAELSSLGREEGGIYVWVKHAFGPQMGLYAIWFQWVSNVIWYPTILSFITATLAYLIAPHLAHNRYFLVSMIIFIFSVLSWINCRGIKTSAVFASVCAISGLLVPMVMIIILGLIWWLSGKTLQIHFSGAHTLIPSFANHSAWVALTGIVLSFCGIEIATVHARNVKRPQRSYPIAMLITTGVLLFTLLLGSLAIAFVLPAAKISLVSGIMQAYDAFFSSYHLHWLLPVVALMLIMGGLGGVNNWIIAPSRGLLLAAEDHQIPSKLAVVNVNLAPHRILFGQVVIVIILSLLFLFMPTVNESYMFLNELAVQLYMVMYILMFVAAVKLRFKPMVALAEQDSVLDIGFRIPGANWGICVVALVGVLACVLTILIGFLPPPHIIAKIAWHYQLMLAVGLVLLSLPPYALHWLRKIPRLKPYLN